MFENYGKISTIENMRKQKILVNVIFKIKIKISKNSNFVFLELVMFKKIQICTESFFLLTESYSFIRAQNY